MTEQTRRLDTVKITLKGFSLYTPFHFSFTVPLKVDFFNENYENHGVKFIQEQNGDINNRVGVGLKPSEEILCPGSLVLF